MNIYQMYHRNGCKFGFWVQRYSWETWVAQITGIDGVIEGEKIEGKPPYFTAPKVYADFYKNGKFVNNGQISCPGSFGYNIIHLSNETQ